MSFLIRSAGKDLRRRLRDPLSLLVWVGIPVAIAGLLSLVAGGNGGTPTARVMVVDRDSTFLSEVLVGAGDQGPAADLLELQEVSFEEGRRRIDDGDGTALLVIPEGFSDAVLEGTPAELLLVTNPSQRILPGIVREGLEMLVEASFYLQRLVGDELVTMTTGPPEGEESFADPDVAALATGINRRIQALDEVLFPPVLDLQVETADGEEAEDGAVEDPALSNFGTLFLPGLLFMAVLFIAQGVSTDIWVEQEKGTLRRGLLAPAGAAPFLGGTILAGAAVCAAVAAAGMVTAAAFFGVSPWRMPLAVLWSTYAGAALLVYFVLLQLFATSRQGGYLISTIVVFPLIMIGGSFFPFQAMPEWMAAVGRWTPNGLAVVRLQEIMVGTLDPSALAASALGIGLPAAGAFLLAVRRLRGGFAAG